MICRMKNFDMRLMFIVAAVMISRVLAWPFALLWFLWNVDLSSLTIYILSKFTTALSSFPSSGYFWSFKVVLFQTALKSMSRKGKGQAGFYLAAEFKCCRVAQQC